MLWTIALGLFVAIAHGQLHLHERQQLHLHERQAYWDNTVEYGPNTWKQDYPECAGLRQSPISLPTKPENYTFIRRLGFYNYEFDRDLYIQNNGYTVDLLIGEATNGADVPDCGGSIFAPGQHFKLHKLEFHWGSESTRGSDHILEGKAWPGEMQLYHYDHRYGSYEDAAKVPGGIVVAVIMFQLSPKDNKNLDPLLDNLYMVNGTSKPHYIGVHNMEWIYPIEFDAEHDCEFYIYEGSMTSPPCSEVAIWHVYMDKTDISEKQLNHLRSLVSPYGVPLRDNTRPVQPQNDRKVWQFREKDVVAITRKGRNGDENTFYERIIPGMSVKEMERRWMQAAMDRHMLNPHLFMANRGAAQQQFRQQFQLARGSAMRQSNDPSGFKYIKPYLGPLPETDPTAGGYGR